MPRTGRSDYGSIGLPDMPEDEPIFILRAKDATAPHAVRSWAWNLQALDQGDDGTVQMALAHADEMENYARQHYGGGKTPDAPVSPAD